MHICSSRNSLTEPLYIRMDEMFKAASETATVIERSPHSSDTKHCPFHTRFGVPMYEYYQQNPQKGTRFAQAMRGWSQCESYQLQVSSLCNLLSVQQPILNRKLEIILILKIQWIARLRSCEMASIGSR